MAMTLNSPAFKQDDQIPSKYTCEGEDLSPPLAWDGVPEGTKSYFYELRYSGKPAAFLRAFRARF